MRFPVGYRELGGRAWPKSDDAGIGGDGSA